MGERLSIGLVGAGAIAREHALSLKRDPRIERLLIFDADPERAEKFAAEFSARVFDSMADVVEDCDVVWLCSPPAFHLDGVQRACAAGKPVFCEKPLALTARDSAAIRTAVKKAGVPLFMGHSGRFSAPAIAMKELSATAEIGTVTRVWSQRLGYFDPKVHPAWRLADDKSGGVVVEFGIHEIDFVHWVGGDIASVYAAGSSATLNPGKYQDHVSAIGTLKSGAIASVIVSAASPRYLWQRGVDGTTGSLFWDDSDFGHVLLLRPGEAPHRIELNPPGWKDEHTGENFAIRDQARAIVSAILDGAPPPVNISDGVAAMSVALGIKQSVRSGQVVQLETVQA